MAPSWTADGLLLMGDEALCGSTANAAPSIVHEKGVTRTEPSNGALAPDFSRACVHVQLFWVALALLHSSSVPLYGHALSLLDTVMSRLKLHQSKVSGRACVHAGVRVCVGGKEGQRLELHQSIFFSRNGELFGWEGARLNACVMHLLVKGIPGHVLAARNIGFLSSRRCQPTI